MVDLTTEWEANARAFASLIDDRGTPHHRYILNPCIERLLGDVAGKTMLDAGCGEGYLSRYYAEKGANVTGVDISPRLIEVSKELTGQTDLDIKFLVADLRDLRPIGESSFDIILCNLVLLNILELDAVLSELHRVLRSGGILVFSVVHPTFNFYGPGSWEMGEKDPETRRRKGLFFKVDNYFDEKEYQHYWRTRDGEKFPRPITFFHRTLSSYLNELTDAGFRLDEVDEPRPKTDDDFFDRERRIPFFLVCRASKSK